MKTLALIYMYSIMPVIDIIVAGVMYLKWIAIGRPEFDNEAEFNYKKDPLEGALNYNWLFKFQAVLCGYEGDCDKFATMAKWRYPGGRIYSILPKNPLKIYKAHVVYECCQYYFEDFDGLALKNRLITLSNGDVYDCKVNDFVKKYYGDSWFIVKMPY